MKEQTKIKGVFKLKVFKHGKLVEQFEEKNLVVNGGRDATTKLIGGDGTNKHITTIAFGTGSVSPVIGDTTLTGEFTKAITSHSYPATGQLQIDWTLESTENNGMTIAEYGLKCADATLFARKVRAAIVKDSSIRLEGSWTLTF